jgi:hypothetical protein
VLFHKNSLALQDIMSVASSVLGRQTALLQRLASCVSFQEHRFTVSQGNPTSGGTDTTIYRYYSSGEQDGEIKGPKSTLRLILAEADTQQGLTAEQLWELAQTRGLKSKRFMKMMLKQMRSKGEILTGPNVKASDGFVYSLVRED